MVHRMMRVGVSALTALTVVSSGLAHASGERAEPGPPTEADLITQIGAATGGTALNISSLAGNAVRFRFRIGTDFDIGDTGWFVDDVSVYNCGPRPRDPVAPNKLRNRGFEFDWDRNSFVDSWSANDRFLRSPTQHRSGRFSARLQDPANAGSFTVAQNVGVRPRSRYRFVGYVDIPATSDGFRFRAELVWRTRAGAAIGRVVVLHSRVRPTGGAWVRMAKSRLVAPVGAARAEIRLVGVGLAARAYVDDFYFGR